MSTDYLERRNLTNKERKNTLDTTNLKLKQIIRF